MTEHSVPLDALHRAYRIWDESKGTNPKAFLDLMADEIEIRSATNVGQVGPLKFTGPRKTKVDAARYFADILDEWQMEFWRVNDIICEGGTAVVLGTCSWMARPTGRIVTSDIAVVTRFRDGKMVSFQEYFDTAAAAEAMTARE